MSEVERSRIPQDDQRRAGMTGKALAANSLLFVGLGIAIVIQTNAWQGYAIIALALQAAIGEFVGALLIDRGKRVLGGWIIYTTTWIAPAGASFLIASLGFVALAYMLTTMYFIIRWILVVEHRRYAYVISTVLLALPIVAEFWEPASRLAYQPFLVISPILIVLLVITLLFFVFRQAWQGNIRSRLTASFLGLVLVPILVSSGISAYVIRESAEDTAYLDLESAAALKENEIKTWIETMRDTLSIVFNQEQEIVITHALLDIDEHTDHDHGEEHDEAGGEGLTKEEVFDQITDDLNVVLAKTDVFTELLVLDQEGQVVLSTEDAQVGKIYATEPFFQIGLEGYYVQAPVYSQSLDAITIFIAKPLVDEHGHAGGVLAGRANLTQLQEIMLADIGTGQTSETYLVRGNHAVMTPLKFEGYPVNETYIRTQGANTAIDTRQDGTAAYTDYRGEEVFGAYRWLPDLDVALLAEVDRDEALQASSTSILISISVAVVASGLALVVALFVTRTIANPIADLATAAQDFAAGRLEQTVEFERQDEIGTLAKAFNSMVIQLRELIGTLEQRVAERTRALETSTEVGRRLSTILDQDELVREVVEQVQNAFDYYHAHIYLFDDEKENLLMAGGTGEAGQTLLERGHSVERGQGLVGRAADTNLVVLVSDVYEDETWLPNPLLPETKSEVAVPIAVGTEVLGVLDVQDDEAGRLDQADADLLQSIANQVATALQNARAYQRAQERAARESKLGDVRQQIQSTIKVEDALKVAARELGRVLGTETSVKLRSSRPERPDKSNTLGTK